MDDADLNLAVNGVVWGGYATTGQRCTAASRVIVHEKIKPKVEKMVCEQIKKLKLGNGLDPETDIGPLVNKKAQDKTKEYCQIGQSMKVLSYFPEDKLLDNLKGWFFEPTLFTDCTSPNADLPRRNFWTSCFNTFCRGLGSSYRHRKLS